MHQSKGFEHPKRWTVACIGEEDLEPMELEAVLDRRSCFCAVFNSWMGRSSRPGTTTAIESTGYPGRAFRGSARPALSHQRASQPAAATTRKTLDFCAEPACAYGQCCAATYAAGENRPHG